MTELTTIEEVLWDCLKPEHCKTRRSTLAPAFEYIGTDARKLAELAEHVEVFGMPNYTTRSFLTAYLDHIS